MSATCPAHLILSDLLYRDVYYWHNVSTFVRMRSCNKLLVYKLDLLIDIMVL
jgi:hypothetical protein